MIEDRLLNAEKPSLGKIHHFSIGIAHWFLPLLLVLPWAAFLAWRSQRLKRLTEAKP
ncbi:hypothetical protein OKA05_08655 [Luteolibacter arcticus]|uniref:Uncharacterized protein n=1 Tax=Luteolibacter arcticus TaxID=1581411 RepID=A0ABT3GG76_9BACT|nr:hypothetical protein [Luteolibacter arcticus]MCW1922622.1 hypothetical protein [Luteolibacter arcticus]